MRHTSPLLLMLLIVSLSGCGMFVDLDEITYAGQTSTNGTPGATTPAVGDMDGEDMSHTEDMGSPEEDMSAVLRECDPFDDQCPGSRRCVIDLTSRSPPHAIEEITCKGDGDYSSKREGESCGEQKDCFPGYVCTTTANERERQCVKYCRTTDDCRGNRTCVVHFAEQLGEDFGLCD